MPDALWIRLALGLVLLALAARFWRALHLERSWQRLLEGVPPQLAMLWAYQDPRHGAPRGAAPKQRSPALSCVDVLFHLSRLDRRQMARFHPRTPPTRFEQLLAQFTPSAKADGHDLPGEPELGERLLAQHLSHDAHDVLLESSTAPTDEALPGCGALVDGLRVRLIASPDAAVIQQCLDHAPGVVVVTVADHGPAFAARAKVVALAEITHAEIAAAASAGVQQGVAALPEGADPTIAKGERPTRENARSAKPSEDKALTSLTEVGSLLASQAIPPALYTAYRTAQLAAKGDGTWLAAAKGELVDTAASSVGGWAGGAMLGAVLGPVGMIAGGLIGGLLGSKLAAGITSNSREKKLRQLLADQEKLLGKVPRLAMESLAAQARHLGGVVNETRGDPGFELWPSAERVARDQLAAEYRRWQRRVSKQARELGAWLKGQPALEKRSARAAELLNTGDLPWSEAWLDLRSQLAQLSAKIDSERKRLGQ